MKKKALVWALFAMLTIMLAGCPSTESPVDTTIPGAVSMVRVDTTSTSIVLTWTDPTDSDLASVLIQYKESGTYAYTNQTASKGAETATLSVSSVGTVYNIRVIAVDSADNQSPATSFNLKLTSTAKEYHFITTAADLNAVRGGIVGYDTWDLSDGYILMVNLDISSYDPWVPLGSTAGHFTGVFEGNFHEISGLTITGTANFQGLFGITDPGTHISDLGVSGTVAGAAYIGGLIGSGQSTISNCHSAVTVTGTGQNVGGLVGFNTGSMTNCYATMPASGVNFVGGLAGSTNGTVSNCHATGNVDGGTSVYTGGLVGMHVNGVMSACYATGNVTSSGNYLGGLVGCNGQTDSDAASITQCHASGTVTGTADNIGGLVGCNKTAASISLCYATGAATGKNYVGGCAGYNSGTISRCYGSGNASSSGMMVGGFVGANYSGTISDCFTWGGVSLSVAGAYHIGGFAGCNDGTGTITNSYSNNSVNYAGCLGDRYAAFVGYHNSSGTYTSCYFDSSKSNLADARDNTTAAVNLTGVDGHPTADMLQQATYTGWNFSGTWSYTTNSYPLLTGLPSPY